MTLITRNIRAITAAVAVIALMAAPQVARAGYQIRVYDDGVLQAGITSVQMGNSFIFAGTTTNFSITNGSALSNNPGTQAFANLGTNTGSQVGTMFGSAGGTHTLRIEITQDGFTAPVGTPITLSTSAGGAFGGYTSSVAGNKVDISVQGFLDNTNTPFGQPVAGGSGAVTSSTTATGLTTPIVFNPSASINYNVPGGTPFSITTVIEYKFTLAAGSGQDIAGVSTAVAAAVPAPAGLWLAALGVPCMGLAARLRRRLTA